MDIKFTNKVSEKEDLLPNITAKIIISVLEILQQKHKIACILIGCDCGCEIQTKNPIPTEILNEIKETVPA